MAESSNFPNVNREPEITVVGLGGAGLAALKYLCHRPIDGVEYVVYDSHYIPLQYFTGIPSFRTSARRLNLPEFTTDIKDVDAFTNPLNKIAILVSGLGGKTGAKMITTIARLCKARGQFVIGYVTLPFNHESGERIAYSRDTLHILDRYTEITCVVSNSKLREMFGSLPFEQAFEMPEAVLNDAVQTIAESFYKSTGYFDYEQTFKSALVKSGFKNFGYFF